MTTRTRKEAWITENDGPRRFDGTTPLDRAINEMLRRDLSWFSDEQIEDLVILMVREQRRDQRRRVQQRHEWLALKGLVAS